MHTVLGANGPIGEELVRELDRHHTTDLRVVSRRPRAVVGGEQLVAADLTDAEATDRAVAGSDVVYLTAGLPMDSALWEHSFPPMMRNVVDAAARHGARLVVFDNTYMYPGTVAVQTEDTAFAPNGRKGRVRAEIARTVLDAMASGRVEAIIARAPEFYGPAPTKSLTNTLVFDRIRAGRRALVPVSARTRRSLIWTPDASRAMALLGTTDDAYGRTWHLPTDPTRLTYAEIVHEAERVTGRSIGYTVVPQLAFTVVRRFSAPLAEVDDLLPRYHHDNLFDSSAFTQRFPGFRTTTYREGIATLVG